MKEIHDEALRMWAQDLEDAAFQLKRHEEIHSSNQRVLNAKILVERVLSELNTVRDGEHHA